jgi:hypothetical protein
MQAGAKYKQRYWEKGKEREERLQIVSQPLATLGSNLGERNRSQKYTRQQRSVSRSSACQPGKPSGDESREDCPFSSAL